MALSLIMSAAVLCGVAWSSCTFIPSAPQKRVVEKIQVAASASSAPEVGAIQAARQEVRDAQPALNAAMAAYGRAQKSNVMVVEKAAAVTEALDPVAKGLKQLETACGEVKAAGSMEGEAMRIWVLGQAEATDARNVIADVKKFVGEAPSVPEKDVAPAAAEPAAAPKDRASFKKKYEGPDLVALKIEMREKEEAAAAFEAQRQRNLAARAEAEARGELDEEKDYSAFLWLGIIFGGTFAFFSLINKQ